MLTLLARPVCTTPKSAFCPTKGIRPLLGPSLSGSCCAGGAHLYPTLPPIASVVWFLQMQKCGWSCANFLLGLSVSPTCSFLANTLRSHQSAPDSYRLVLPPYLQRNSQRDPTEHKQRSLDHRSFPTRGNFRWSTCSAWRPMCRIRGCGDLFLLGHDLSAAPPFFVRTHKKPPPLTLMRLRAQMRNYRIRIDTAKSGFHHGIREILWQSNS